MFLSVSAGFFSMSLRIPAGSRMFLYVSLFQRGAVRKKLRIHSLRVPGRFPVSAAVFAKTKEKTHLCHTTLISWGE